MLLLLIALFVSLTLLIVIFRVIQIGHSELDRVSGPLVSSVGFVVSDSRVVGLERYLANQRALVSPPTNPPLKQDHRRLSLSSSFDTS